MAHTRRASFVRFVLFAAALLFVSGAACAQQVAYNFMPGTDFSKYHTFKWVQLPSNESPPPNS